MKTMIITYAFDKLSLEEKLAHFQKVAERSKSRWGFPEDARLRLLNFSENATFLVEWGAGERAILRVHRLAYAKLTNIKTELNWILSLSEETDLTITTPVMSEAGHYVETIVSPELDEERYVVCFNYAPGKAPTDSSDDNEKLIGLLNVMGKIPSWITFPLFRRAASLNAWMGKRQTKTLLTKDDCQMYQTLGKIAATLHLHGMAWKVPDYYDRMEWDWDGTFGPEWNNFYGADYRDTTCIAKRDIEILTECVEIMKERMKLYGKGPDRYGMIHSDLRMANLLQDKSTITVLDFDDCGRGWFMYDIAGIVALMEHRGDIDIVVGEVLKGYESVRPISEKDREEIPSFIMMRRIGMLQSLNYRLGNVATGEGEVMELTPEVLVFYAKGTVKLAQAYIQNYAYDTFMEHDQAIAKVQQTSATAYSI